jgi:mannose-6-phosphate isomerase
MPIPELTQPLVFEPLFIERVWGGRRLESSFHKRLPPGVRIGESWEVVDREEAQSVVHEGPLQGITLRELWTNHRAEVFGAGLPSTARFPLLFKILDAQERLSMQVHPPPEVAPRLGGEPKTEMWYLLDAMLGGDVYAGLKRGVTRADFERALREGNVIDLVHRLRVRPGDAVFIPSGRVHAIGSGNLLIEVQQNSDTTYRVFDWNRVGLDGRLRTLHVEESLQSINFSDYEPGVVQPHGETLVECAHFRVEKWVLDRPRSCPGNGFAVFAVVEGEVDCAGRLFQPGDFFLVPAAIAQLELTPRSPGVTVLRTAIPSQA